MCCRMYKIGLSNEILMHIFISYLIFSYVPLTRYL